MNYKNIIVNKKESIGYIKINRPQVLNALNHETIKEIKNAINELENDKEVKVVILTGEGKAFIAGADIKSMVDMNTLEAKEFAELGHSMINAIEKSRLIFIAAVNGYALGGGCETMMACDIVIAGKSAKIGQPEINLGIHPGFGGTQRLPRIVGILKAKELLLTGKSIDAEEALKIGLVNKIVEDNKLLDEAENMAKEISNKSGIQINFIKELVNKGINIDLGSADSLEISYFSSSFSTHDQKEGMKAFLEKRKPYFKGE